LDLTKKFPTDRGNFDESMLISANFKRSIILYEPCRPITFEFPFTPDGGGYNRKFTSHFYLKTVKSGIRISGLWLCCFIILDRVYCETCWLFSNRFEKKFQK